MSASLSISSVPISAFDEATIVPAPQVLAWASFLGPDGPLTTGTAWSAGSTWTLVVGTWAEDGDMAVPTRSLMNARLIGDVPAAGSTGRVVAIVSSTGGGNVSDAGVAAAATSSGTRSAILAVVTPDGSLTIRSVPGAPFITLATSAAGVVVEPSVEVSLQVVGATVTATARPLWSREPTVSLTATLTPATTSDVAANTGYGVVAHQTTAVAFSAVRVEVPA